MRLRIGLREQTVNGELEEREGAFREGEQETVEARVIERERAPGTQRDDRRVTRAAAEKPILAEDAAPRQLVDAAVRPPHLQLSVDDGVNLCRLLSGAKQHVTRLEGDCLEQRRQDRQLA